MQVGHHLTSHSKPSPQVQHLQSLLVKQVASCPLQTLSLINTGTQTRGHMPYDAALGWLTHYMPHRVPVQLGDNSIVWSEQIGACWFEPLLEGYPGPLVRLSNVLYVPCLASNVLSLFSLTVRGYTFTGTGRCLSFSKDGQVLFQATVTGRCIGQLLGRTAMIIAPCPHQPLTPPHHTTLCRRTRTPTMRPKTPWTLYSGLPFAWTCAQHSGRRHMHSGSVINRVDLEGYN